MNANHDGGILGRLIALFLIFGAAYGARAIARGGLGCGLGGGSCCVMATPVDASPAPAKTPDAAPKAAEQK